MKLEIDSYKKIIDNLHDGLYIVDRSRVMIFIIKKGERLYDNNQTAYV